MKFTVTTKILFVNPVNLKDDVITHEYIIDSNSLADLSLLLSEELFEHQKVVSITPVKK